MRTTIAILMLTTGAALAAPPSDPLKATAPIAISPTMPKTITPGPLKFATMKQRLAFAAGRENLRGQVNYGGIVAVIQFLQSQCRPNISPCVHYLPATGTPQTAQAAGQYLDDHPNMK